MKSLPLSLSKYSINEKVSNRNKTTKFFSERKFVIDKFHFRNHIDSWCHENCDPNEVPELNGMNTEICEQLFRGINPINAPLRSKVRAETLWLFLNMSYFKITVHKGAFANSLSSDVIICDEISYIDILHKLKQTFCIIYSEYTTVEPQNLTYINIYFGTLTMDMFTWYEDKFSNENLYNWRDHGPFPWLFYTQWNWNYISFA